MFPFHCLDYNVWLVIGDSSVSLHLLIRPYSQSHCFLDFLLIIIIIDGHDTHHNY